jgi:hypothetical protein
LAFLNGERDFSVEIQTGHFCGREFGDE